MWSFQALRMKEIWFRRSGFQLKVNIGEYRTDRGSRFASGILEEVLGPESSAIGAKSMDQPV